MSSPSRTSPSLRARRRSNMTAAGPRRPAMSEQQLAAYLAARDAVRRANRISLLLPYRTRQELSVSLGSVAQRVPLHRHRAQAEAERQ